MLRRLGLPMSRVVLFNVISNLAFLNVWGRLGDRYGSRSVLQVTAPLFLACLLVWSVSGQPWLGGMLLPLLVLVHVLMGSRPPPREQPVRSLADTGVSISMGPANLGVGVDDAQDLGGRPLLFRTPHASRSTAVHSPLTATRQGVRSVL
jgi:MFS family permease